ncbi:MAG: hypothetical protein ABI036_08475 [Fibrobacteria bacterium]
MNRNHLGLIIFTLVTASQAQPLDLKGRVVRADGTPVQDAVVELKTRGTAARTAADGTFDLSVNTALRPDRGAPFQYRLNPDFLTIDVRVPSELRIEVIDGAGRPQGGFARRLEAGSHRIGLTEAMPATGGDAGLFFLRLRLGGRTVTHPFFHSGNGPSRTVFAPAYRVAAAKRSGGADSLLVRKAGYLDFAREIASYTAADLGDLVLVPAPDDGSFCVKQRKDHTSEGAEITICEALFDQPPRVHLPNPAASSAYAVITATAFVTLAGESFPRTNAGSGDPELLRYGSAVYEIKIQDSKATDYRPVVLFADSLFLAPLMGKALEGLIAKRINGSYELEATLPIRLRLPPVMKAVVEQGVTRYVLRPSIENLATAITASDGTCMPGLSSHGAQAPFDAGKDVVITLTRVVSMHGFGDDEIVFNFDVDGVSQGSVMSRTWFFTPLDLVKNTLTPTGTYTGLAHGFYKYTPTLVLNPASGGGGACTPK